MAQGWEQYFFVKRSTMHTMCSQAPAVFELLPDPRAPPTWPPRHSAPVARVTMRATDSDDTQQSSSAASPGPAPPARRTRTTTYSLSEFPQLMQGSLQGYEVETYRKRKVALDMNPECWEISDATRAAWRGAALPDGCEFYNIFGTGFSTAYDVEYGSVEEPLESLTEIATSEPMRTFSHVEGDCTVPVCCATAGACRATWRGSAARLPLDALLIGACQPLHVS